jgi:hypothetical protein
MASQQFSHRFAIDPDTAIIGLVGVAMFWSSFLLGRKRSRGSD